MLAVLVVAYVTLTAAHAATTALYQISSNDSWAAQGGACSGPTGIYERSLSPDVLLRLLPYPGPGRPLAGTALGLSFIVADGHRVRLVSRDVSVATDGGAFKEISIATFRSLKEEFTGDQDLIGAGRFARDPSIKEKPAGDVFGVRLVVAETRVDRFSVAFPALEVDGVPVKIADVSFRYEETWHPPCVQ